MQIIVDRTALGADGVAGGDFVVTANLAGNITATGNVTFLGVTTAVLIGENPNQTVTKMKVDFDLVTGVTSVVSGNSLIITYDITATIPTVPTSELDNGMTATHVVADNRDVVSVLKHSEYEDSEAGLVLATAALYSLIAASAVTDAAQLQRIRLSSSDAVLITTDITEKVVGKDYTTYTA